MMYQLTFFIKNTDKVELTKEFDKLANIKELDLYDVFVFGFESSGYRRSYILKHGSLTVKTLNKDNITFVMLLTSEKSAFDEFRAQAMVVFDLIDPVIKEF